MIFTAAVSALALATAALAQDANSTSQIIHVGSDGKGTAGLFFEPSSIKAANGTVVTFVFDGAPGNHTVAQSAFAKPCEPLAGGFDTGYITIPAGTTTDFPTFNLTIENDTKPIWFYCAQLAGPKGAHCPAGMVGAINAPDTGNTFESFTALVSGASVVNPTPALSGVNAFATAAVGPLSGSITAFAAPSGTAPPSSGSGAGSSAGSGTNTSGAPNSTGTGSGKNGAGAVAANGVAAFVAAAFGVALL
ncbi:hypothetical protein C8Q79DRAFT_921389 [Trametes meyenii]|nr:hypothetical protein C8Q79DRAFT_921389 [Trametes meyenii]